MVHIIINYQDQKIYSYLLKFVSSLDIKLELQNFQRFSEFVKGGHSGLEAHRLLARHQRRELVLGSNSKPQQPPGF